SYHISQSAEGAKIALSSTEVTSVDMAYLEAGLRTDINREQLQTAISNELNKFIGLMQEVEQQAQVAPDVIYVTGGTARSPIVDAYIRAAYPQARIVFGDLFGSVASGLTTWAHRIFS
ncbi:MAG: molecular chaperone, partial [Gammaproteobacteria bacterium]|nr:molecular chaperone [Gammaproteobacteria bacterium]